MPNQNGDDDSNRAYDWKIPEFKRLSAGPGKVFSDPFSCAGEMWRVMLFPRGNNSEAGRAVSVYVELQGAKDKSPYFYADVRFKFTVLHPINPAKHMAKESSYQFDRNMTDRGFNSVISLQKLLALEEGYLSGPREFFHLRTELTVYIPDYYIKMHTRPSYPRLKNRRRHKKNLTREELRIEQTEQNRLAIQQELCEDEEKRERKQTRIRKMRERAAKERSDKRQQKLYEDRQRVRLQESAERAQRASQRQHESSGSSSANTSSSTNTSDRSPSTSSSMASSSSANAPQNHTANTNKDQKPRPDEAPSEGSVPEKRRRNRKRKKKKKKKKKNIITDDSASNSHTSPSTESNSPPQQSESSSNNSQSSSASASCESAQSASTNASSQASQGSCNNSTTSNEPANSPPKCPSNEPDRAQISPADRQLQYLDPDLSNHDVGWATVESRRKKKKKKKKQRKKNIQKSTPLNITPTPSLSGRPLSNHTPLPTAPRPTLPIANGHPHHRHAEGFAKPASFSQVRPPQMQAGMKLQSNGPRPVVPPKALQHGSRPKVVPPMLNGGPVGNTALAAPMQNSNTRASPRPMAPSCPRRPPCSNTAINGQRTHPPSAQSPHQPSRRSPVVPPNAATINTNPQKQQRSPLRMLVETQRKGPGQFAKAPYAGYHLEPASNTLAPADGLQPMVAKPMGHSIFKPHEQHTQPSMTFPNNALYRPMQSSNLTPPRPEFHTTTPPLSAAAPPHTAVPSSNPPTGRAHPHPHAGTGNTSPPPDAPPNRTMFSINSLKSLHALPFHPRTTDTLSSQPGPTCTMTNTHVEPPLPAMPPVSDPFSSGPPIPSTAQLPPQQQDSLFDRAAQPNGFAQMGSLFDTHAGAVGMADYKQPLDTPTSAVRCAIRSPSKPLQHGPSPALQVPVWGPSFTQQTTAAKHNSQHQRYYSLFGGSRPSNPSAPTGESDQDPPMTTTPYQPPTAAPAPSPQIYHSMQPSMSLGSGVDPWRWNPSSTLAMSHPDFAPNTASYGQCY